MSDGLILAQYFSDTREHLKSRDYYLRLQSSSDNRSDYSYQIFKATAEAVWNDLLPFDSLPPFADTVLTRSATNHANLGQMGQIMGNVARRTGHTDRIAKYLEAGARATSSLTDQQGIAMNRDLVADYALHVLNDTARAIGIKKLALGKGWETDPARYYQYGEFCLQRKIDLLQAENYVRMATNKASDGKFKAKHLRLLAEILFVLGRTDEAIRTGEEAIDQDPTSAYFDEKLKKWQGD